MDQIQYYDKINPKTLILLINNNYLLLKRTLQLVISVSVLSFFLCCSSGFSIHHESFHAYFSTCLLSSIFERKYMFLVCNAILAFLAKNSLVMTSSPPFDEIKTPVSDVHAVAPLVIMPQEQEEMRENTLHEKQCFAVEIAPSVKCSKETNLQRKKDLAAELASSIPYGEEEEEDEIEGTDGVDEEDEEDEANVTQGNDVEEEVEDGALMAATNEEEEEEEEEEVVNTDELNRKFEEFIRKMKEEIRIQAQRQQLVYV